MFMFSDQGQCGDSALPASHSTISSVRVALVLERSKQGSTEKGNTEWMFHHGNVWLYHITGGNHKIMFCSQN